MNENIGGDKRETQRNSSICQKEMEDLNIHPKANKEKKKGLERVEELSLSPNLGKGLVFDFLRFCLVEPNSHKLTQDDQIHLE